MSAPPAAAGTGAGSARVPRAWWLVALALVATGWPGIMSNDSLAMLEQARSLAFTDWHPPIMALAWAPLDKVLPGPGLMLVAQAALYAVAMAWLCAEAFPTLVARTSPWLVVPVFALFPPVAALNVMVWKDVWMSAWLVLALACLFRMARLAPERRRAGAIGLVACCLLATAFRHNALAATAGLLAGAAWLLLQGRLARWSRLFAACVAGVAVAVLLHLAVSAATRLVAEPAQVTTPILLHDIAGMIVYSGEDADAVARQALALAPGMTEAGHGEFVRRVWQQYSAAAAVRLLSTRRRPDAAFTLNIYAPHDADAVQRAWRTLLRDHPAAYLRHRLAVSACLFQLCDRKDWNHHSYVLNERYALPPGLPAWQATLRTWLLNPALSPLYAPLAWLALACMGGLLALRSVAAGRHAAPLRDGVPVFLMLSAVGLAVSLFFTAPIESYRYVHWIIIAGWTTAWLLVQRALRRSATGA